LSRDVGADTSRMTEVRKGRSREREPSQSLEAGKAWAPREPVESSITGVEWVSGSGTTHFDIFPSFLFGGRGLCACQAGALPLEPCPYCHPPPRLF
jgi:hypothetical protein